LNSLETRIASDLTSAGISFTYRAKPITYQKPARTAVYTPTFVITDGPKAGIVIQNKGRFVTEDRQKHLVLKTQYPDLDVRFVFSRSKDRISRRPDSVTYAAWCERNGFQYADKSVPAAWIEEMRSSCLSGEHASVKA
jgi:hypothetical protein